MASIPLASLAVALAGCAHAAPTAPTYFTVHEDTLAPEHAAEFEAARRDWVATLRAAHATDQRGTFFEVVGVGFWTLRPLARFADLDDRAAQRTRALAAVPPDALARYDARSDAALAYPHASEIWARDDDVGYAPAGAPTDPRDAPVARVVIEHVLPDSTSDKAYAETWQAIAGALAHARYPLARVCFHPMYGADREITFWLARSKAALDAAPAIADVVAHELGAERAEALRAKLAAVVTSTETHLVLVRDDLSAR
jgi:hypothetical protein